MTKFFTNKKILFGLGTLFILLLWFVISLLFDKNSMIFPSPISAFKAMIELLGKKVTYQYLGLTLLRMLIGFSIAFFFALILGIFAGHNPGFYTFLKPLMNVLKSVPTVAFVYLFIIIFQPKYAPIYVVILVSLPILFESVVTGIKKTDPDVLDAARVDGANKITEVLTGMTKGGIGAAISAFQGSEANLNNVFGYTLIVIIIVLLFTSVSEYLKRVFINK